MTTAQYYCLHSAATVHQEALNDQHYSIVSLPHTTWLLYPTMWFSRLPFSLYNYVVVFIFIFIFYCILQHYIYIYIYNVWLSFTVTIEFQWADTNSQWPLGKRIFLYSPANRKNGEVTNEGWLHNYRTNEIKRLCLQQLNRKTKWAITVDTWNKQVPCLWTTGWA